MYCPECESEYVEGITRCSDCDVALVEELGEHVEPEGEEQDGLSELMQTANAVELEAVVSLMERAHIPYLIQAGTAMNMLQRAAGIPPGVGAWEARLWVDTRQIKDARERLTAARKRLTEKEPTDG